MDTVRDRFAVARTALSRIPHPVAIIGAAVGEERSCATGTAMYVSLDPALVAIAEHPKSHTAELIMRSGQFSVSFLWASQQEIATAAGRHANGNDKFAALHIATCMGPDGCSAPGVEGSQAVLWCGVRQMILTGDHQLVIGEVIASTGAADDAPALLRFRRRYLQSGEWRSGESPEGYPT